MSKDDRGTTKPDPLRKERSAEEKMRLVLDAARLFDAELGAFLRREGLHQADLDEWRDAMLTGLKPPPSKHARSQEVRRVKQLEKELHRKDKALAEAAALLVLQKKSRPSGGTRTTTRRRRTTSDDHAHRRGRRRRRAHREGVRRRRHQHADARALAQRRGLYRSPRRTQPRAGAPAHRRREGEDPRGRELARVPRQEPQADRPDARRSRRVRRERGRLLPRARENDQLAHRGRARPPTASKPKELVATAPNQIWCWDITYMRAAVRGTFYFLYLVVDVFSRKIVAWTVESEESQDLAVDMIERATREHRVPENALVLHADNGGPMKGSTMVATLQRLGIVPSFPRPRVSDDNAYAEALFKTLK